jgi:DNA-directed RNA polymerase subunit M/transcription elongation factor TFIIS
MKDDTIPFCPECGTLMKETIDYCRSDDGDYKVQAWVCPKCYHWGVEPDEKEQA